MTGDTSIYFQRENSPTHLGRTYTTLTLCVVKPVIKNENKVIRLFKNQMNTNWLNFNRIMAYQNFHHSFLHNILHSIQCSSVFCNFKCYLKNSFTRQHCQCGPLLACTFSLTATEIMFFDRKKPKFSFLIKVWEAQCVVDIFLFMFLVPLWTL